MFYINGHILICWDDKTKRQTKCSSVLVMRHIDTVCTVCARSGSGPERFLTLPQGKTEVLEKVLGWNSRVMKDIAQ